MTDDPLSAPDLANIAQLATEGQNPASSAIDTMSTTEMLTVINDEDARVASVVRWAIPQIAKAIDAIVERIRAGGRLIYIGAGTSGRLGVLDASECPPTFNTPPELVVGLIAGGDHALRHPIESVEDQPDSGAAALDEIGLTSADVVVGIAASGRTPFVLGAIKRAKEIGAATIGISNTETSLLSNAVDIPIPLVVGAEVLSGSTRMKAGTAQKLALNMLSTGSMIRLGKTYGNLMVDVQPTNAKLRQRAIGIVQRATGIAEPEARAALMQSDGDVKIAIVATKREIDPDTARQLLNEANGSVRLALGEV